MGLFDRFKKNESKKEKPKKETVPKDIEIDEEQLALKEIALNSKDRYERANAADQMMGCPGEVFEKQLRETHIKVRD